jgi:hypothetical protein
MANYYYYKPDVNFRGVGKLLRESDPEFSHQVRYNVTKYQRVLRVPSTGEEIPTTHKFEGFISTDPALLIYTLQQFTDLVLVLADGSKAGIYIMNAKSGEIKTKRGFTSPESGSISEQG